MLDLALLRVEVDSSPAPVAWAPPTAWTRINPRDPAGNPINGVKRIHIECGQQSAYGPVEPGEMLLTLDDRNGYLDQSNPTSPIADLLTPGRQLRVVHVRSDDGTDVVLMHGTLQRVITSAAPPFDAEFSVVDLVGMMGATETPESLVSYELRRGVRYPRPAHLFMLRESEVSDTVVLSDDFTDYEASVVGALEQGSSGLIPYTDLAGVKGGPLTSAFSAINYIVLPLAVAPTAPWTYLSLYRGAAGTEAIAIADRNGLNPSFQLAVVGVSGVLEARVQQTDTSRKIVNSTASLTDDRPHMVAMNETGTSLVGYVDGTNVGSVAHTAIKAPEANVVVGIGANTEHAMVCIWGERVLADKQALIWEDVQRPWATHVGSQRVVALLAMSLPGAPLTWATPVALSWLPVSLRRAPLLDILRRLSYADDGRLWAERGVVQWRSRTTAAPAAALRLYGTGGVPVADFTTADGTKELVTQARLETEAGVVEVYEDTAASKRHGVRRLPDPGRLPLKTPLDLWALCERTVHYRSRLQPYTDRISVAVDNPSVSTDGVLATRLYDRIDFARLPRWSSEVVTEQLDVIRYVHDGDAESQTWRTDLFTQPVRRQRLRLSVPNVAANNGASTPNSTAISITGDLDIRARIMGRTQSGYRCVLAKDGTGANDRAYGLFITGSTIHFAGWSSTGVYNSVEAIGAFNMAPGARPMWVRGTFTSAGGWLRIYTSNDGNDWRLVIEVSKGTFILRTTAAALLAGAPTFDTAALNGHVYAGEVRNGINGPVVARFDPNESSGVGDADWVASTGEVWTVGSAAAVEAW